MKMNTTFQASSAMGILRVLALAAITIAALASPPPARADTTIHVNNDSDVAADDGVCTLREAITAANNNSASGVNSGECSAGTTGLDTIDFPTGYHTITLTNGMLPAITSQITIQGNGNGSLVVIEAAASAKSAHDRVLEVKDGGDAELRQVTVQNGVCDGSCADQTYNGGGILVSDGSLTLYNDYVLANTVSGVGSNLSCGGGIYVEAAGTLDIQWTLVGSNEAPQGGGICSDGSVTIETNSGVNGNDAVGYDNGFGRGGGILNHGSLTITDSAVSSNQAPTHTASEAPLPVGEGGGIYNDSSDAVPPAVSIGSSTISGNHATTGAGLYLSDGTVKISQSELNSNVATVSGGAAESLSSAFGNASLFIDTSTVQSNSVTAGDGGGVYVGPGSAGATTNTTFYANVASNDGGGLFVSGPSGAATVVNSTFSDNQAGGDGGGLYASGATLALKNTILANSTAAYDCYKSGGTLATDVNNLIESSYLCGVPVSTGDPKLGPLADNGGPTQTMALLGGSPAINAGDDTTCGNGAGSPDYGAGGLDQRGVTRPQGPHCDIGAYEFVKTLHPSPDFDFDGNATSDLAIYRPSNGVWYIKDQFNSGWGGQAGDVPVPGDYNGDGTADVAIYRPSTGVFYVKNVYNQGWGGQVGDVPVPGDYNGDGKTDVGIWRPSTGVFYVKYVFNSGWGAAGDIPVPGDYNGDGTTDVAVFRPSNDVWYIKGVGNFTWGNSGDVPVPGDYNGDGTTDIAVWRPSTGTWYVRGQSPYLAWGSSTDIPVPGDYDGDGKTDLAVYIPSSGTWSVKDQFDTVWGAASDYPVEAPDTNGDGDPYQ